jgi:predicted RNA-binding Zn-ribbon protein involved in translation (DUF1610 family)
MSPLNPDTIRSTPFVILDERACVSCGYSLKGLMNNGNCPECGRPITARRKDIPRYSDNLVHAPLRWLRVFGFGCTLLLLSGLGLTVTGVGLIIAVLATGGIQTQLAAIPALVVAGGWWLASLLLTRPRPVTRATTIDPKVEWRYLRLAARVTQTFWIATGVLLGLLIRAMSVGAPANNTRWLSIASLASFVVAALGVIPLFVYISNLAFWATDSAVGHSLRICAWMIGFAAFLTVLTVLNGLTHALLLGPMLGGVVLATTYFFILAPVAYLLFCLWGLRSMGRWAIKNHVTAEAKDERLRERAARAATLPRPMTSKVPEEGPVRLETQDRVFEYGQPDQPSSPGYVVKKEEKSLRPFDLDSE